MVSALLWLFLAIGADFYVAADDDYTNKLEEKLDACLGMHQSKLYGGGGPLFDDKSSWKYRDITAIRLECSSNWMHSIQMKYGDTWAKKHGTDRTCSQHGCKTYTKTLENDERITNVTMIIGKTFHFVMIHRATFHTNKGALISCGGDNPKSGKTSEESSGYRLQYINGGAGDFVDSLQFHWSEV